MKKKNAQRADGYKMTGCYSAPEKVTDCIKKRKPRCDAYAGYNQRKSDNCKGRRRDRLWDTYKTRREALSAFGFEKHHEWQRKLSINEDSFYDLVYEIFESEKEFTIDNFSYLYSKYNLSDNVAFNDFLSLFFILADCFKSFVNSLNNAHKKGDSFFIKTTKTAFKFFGDDIVSFYTKGKKNKGRPVHDRTIMQWVKKVNRYLDFNEKGLFERGDDYEEAKKIYLIHLASLIYLDFFHLPYLSIKKLNERLEAKNKILELIIKHNFSTSELFPSQPWQDIRKGLLSPFVNLL